MSDWLTDPQAWISLLTLTGLEIVLGIDNIIFISILAGKLPADQQDRARKIGLMLALLTRIALLASIAWMAKLTTPLFSLLDHGVSGRDLILLIGGLFLLVKSTMEIHHKLEGEEGSANPGAAAKFGTVLVQIMLLDVVFSLDSVITAVGMVNDPTKVSLMMVAVVLAIGVMMLASGAISAFVSKHPSVKMLALSFLIMIGTALMAEALHFHIPKGYIYFSMVFSLAVELLNLRIRTKTPMTSAGDI